MLLDAWEVVGVHKGYVPVSRDDLVALKPEAVFIGHGHFDHAADAIRDAIRSLPECVDVHVGAARSTLFIPNHHDAWFPVIGGGAAAYETQWRAALNTLPQPPQLDYLRDPEDYVKVRSFTVNDPRWHGSRGCLQ